MTAIAHERSLLRKQGLDFRTREQWRATFDYTNDRAVTTPAVAFFLHIAVVDDPGDLIGTEDQVARNIERVGISRFPNTGISYNALAFNTGRLYEAQPLTRRGAHTLNTFRRRACAVHGGSLVAPDTSEGFNNNVNARALCLPQQVGDTVTDAQIDVAARWAAAQIRAGLAVKGARWHGHRCVTAKDCPGHRGFARIPELQRLTEKYVREGLAVELTVMTANLGRGVSESELTANVRRLRHPHAIKGLQEVDEADAPEEHAVIARELPAGWAAFDTRVPISVPQPWRIVRTRITKACDGLAKFTPERVITQALIERLDAPGSPRLVIVNTHFPRRALQTVSRRRQCRKALREVIAYWHARGYTVIWMGDTNQVHMRKMHPLEQPVIDAGPDHIKVVPHPKGVQVEVIRTGSVDLTIDAHDAHFARLRLTTPKE